MRSTDFDTLLMFHICRCHWRFVCCTQQLSYQSIRQCRTNSRLRSDKEKEQLINIENDRLLLWQQVENDREEIRDAMIDRELLNNELQLLDCHRCKSIVVEQQHTSFQCVTI